MPFLPHYPWMLKPSGPPLEAGPLSKPYLGIVPRPCLGLVTVRKGCVRVPSKVFAGDPLKTATSATISSVGRFF
jgi:hypothetical protein